jgi:hypothetical protein
MSDKNIFDEIEGFGSELHSEIDSASTCISTNNVAGKDLNIETLLKAKKLLEDIKDPIAELMREKGFDPDKGDLLVWPVHLFDVFGGLPMPSYVRLSEHVDLPYCVKALSFDLNDIKLSIKI